MTNMVSIVNARRRRRMSKWCKNDPLVAKRQLVLRRRISFSRIFCAPDKEFAWRSSHIIYECVGPAHARTRVLCGAPMSKSDKNQKTERLQVMLDEDELQAIDDWRFGHHMPSRAAAIRELLRRGLGATNEMMPVNAEKSEDFSVIGEASED